MTLYQWLVLAHILAATMWVGGGIMALATSRQMEKAGDAAGRAYASFEVWAGQRIFGPASVSVILFGILMVWQSDAWSLGQTWVWLSLVLAVLSLLIGGLYFGPESGRLAKMMAERGPGDAEVVRRRSRLATMQNLDVVLILVIVALMVFKPGA